MHFQIDNHMNEMYFHDTTKKASAHAGFVLFYVQLTNDILSIH